MLEPKKSQKFIDKMKRLFQLDISVANEKGIIVASSHPQLLGEFHAIAREMIVNNTNDTEERDVRGKICRRNLILRRENTPYGVISIGESTMDTKKIIEIIRYFFEDVLEEYQPVRNPIAQRQHELFVSLFVDQPVNYGKVVQIFSKLHCDPHVLRLPVLVYIKEEKDSSRCWNIIQQTFGDNLQNLCYVVNPHEFILFLQLSYKESFMPLVRAVAHKLFPEGAPGDYLLVYTVPTDDISQYVLSYSQLLWLRDIYGQYNKMVRPIAGIVDAIDLLLITSNGWNSFNNIFTYYERKLQIHHATDDFLQLAEVLIKNGMNYSKAAQALFVHKNTIVFRMNKIKAILDIDPYNNKDHLALFCYLYYYICVNNHTLRSFQKEYDKHRS